MHITMVSLNVFYDLTPTESNGVFRISEDFEPQSKISFIFHNIYKQTMKIEVKNIVLSKCYMSK